MPVYMRNKRRINSNNEKSDSDSCESIINGTNASTSESDISEEMINKIISQMYQKHTQSKAKVKTKLSKNAHKREQRMSESDGDNSLTYESHLSVDIAHEN